MDLTTFFRSFERFSNSDDPTSGIAQFADPFLYAGPEASRVVPVAHFALALQKRKQWCHQAGCKSTSLVSKEETPLDARYTLVATRWRIELDRGGGSAKGIEVGSTFLVDTAGAEPKILMYIAHQDLIQLLEAQGESSGES